MNDNLFVKIVHYSNTGNTILGVLTIVFNIQSLLLCLIDNYHLFKQSSQFVAPKANKSGTPRAHV